jgi:hypothetical protein
MPWNWKAKYANKPPNAQPMVKAQVVKYYPNVNPRRSMQSAIARKGTYVVFCPPFKETTLHVYLEEITQIKSVDHP